MGGLITFLISAETVVIKETDGPLTSALILQQVKGLLRAGDVVLGISGSGGSPNVLRALEYARMMGCWRSA